MDPIRYSAAACQTDLPTPTERSAMRTNTDRMLAMIDSAVAGAAPFLPVRLVVFPEFAHAAPIFATPSELAPSLLSRSRTNTPTANGAEVLIRVSAYMDPWGATEPMCWWTIVNRCRALENTAFVVAANQGASLRHYPPYSWPGGSQIADFDGRLLADASPGPGERIVVAPIDITALRHERATRSGHQMLAHLRTEAYPVYQTHRYPPERTAAGDRSYERNVDLIARAKQSGQRHEPFVTAR
jgi:predicted amidohydrolase